MNLKLREVEHDPKCPLCVNQKWGDFVLLMKVKGYDAAKILAKLRIKHQVHNAYKPGIGKKTIMRHLSKHIKAGTVNRVAINCARRELEEQGEELAEKGPPPREKEIKLQNRMRAVGSSKGDSGKLELLIEEYSALLDEITDIAASEDGPSETGLIKAKAGAMKDLFDMITKKVALAQRAQTGPDVNSMILKYFLMYIVSLYDGAMQDLEVEPSTRAAIQQQVKKKILGWRDFIEVRVQEEGAEVPSDILNSQVDF